jgi:hypothetical protein
MNEAFFKRDDEDRNIYHPTRFARGPWDPKTLHGRVLSGLVAFEVEANCLSDEEIDNFQTARITVDLFRPPPMSPLTVTSETIRSGRRIKVIDVNIAASIEGRGVMDVARGSVVMLKRSENPNGEIWTPPAWGIQAPHEDRPPPDTVIKDPDNTAALPIWETVNVQDDTGEPYGDGSLQHRELGIRRAWIRETYSLISGVFPSQLVRVAQVADFANPFTNSGTRGLNYINADITLYLQRIPVGSWIGTETSYHGSDQGVSVGTMSLYDRCGRVGTSTVCGLAQARS